MDRNGVTMVSGDRLWVGEHGDHCDCVLLANALRMKPSHITFEYCRRVLQKRWRMTCLHGCHHIPPRGLAVERWRDMGDVDRVKAILISNGPTRLG